MIKPILILLGSVFLGLGVIGIIVPGVPTTPFLLLAAGCYARSSDRLYSRLLDHKLFGKYIHNFKDIRSIPVGSIIISIIVMWIMIGISVSIFIKIIYVKIIIVILGIIGTLVIILISATRK